MSSIIVREYLKNWNRDKDVIEFVDSTATVDLAAAALNVDQGRIAKSLTFRANSGALMVVVCGDMKIDNRKFKGHFGQSPKMLNSDEAFKFTGFPVGGICPFALPNGLGVYLDNSMKRFNSVFLACGDANSMIQIELADLENYSKALGWVDVCKMVERC